MRNTPAWFKFFQRYFPGATLDNTNHTLTFTAGAAGFHAHKTPTGAIDGSNDVFHLDHAPLTGTEYVYLNGVVQYPTLAYTIAGNAITFITPPQIGDVIDVSYFL